MKYTKTNNFLKKKNLIAVLLLIQKYNLTEFNSNLDFCFELLQMKRIQRYFQLINFSLVKGNDIIKICGSDYPPHLKSSEVRAFCFGRLALFFIN